MARPGRPAKAKPKVNQWIGSFLDMLTAERGAALNTRYAYERDLIDVELFFQPKNIDITKAKTSDIKAYLDDLARKKHTKGDHTGKIAVRTVARRLSALRQFYCYLMSENVRSDDPTSTIESPKQGRVLPKTLSEAEVTQLIKTAGAPGTANAKRLVCLLEMLYSTGLRVSELVGLPASAVQEGGQFILVEGKGGRERMVPLSDTAQKAINTYLDVRAGFIGEGDDGTQGQWLFPSKTSIVGHLTRQRFAQLLKELAKNAKIDSSKVSPHVLRHAFATHLLQNGADLRAVQKMLGHADIATTQVYTHILGKDVKEKVQKKHPVSKKSAG